MINTNFFVWLDFLTDLLKFFIIFIISIGVNQSMPFLFVNNTSLKAKLLTSLKAKLK